MIDNWTYWLSVVLVSFSGLVAVSGGLVLFSFAIRLVRGWVFHA